MLNYQRVASRKLMDSSSKNCSSNGDSSLVESFPYHSHWVLHYYCIFLIPAQGIHRLCPAVRVAQLADPTFILHPEKMVEEDHFWLVVWNMTGLCLSIQLGRIMPTDELIFFRGVETTNQIFIHIWDH